MRCFLGVSHILIDWTSKVISYLCPVMFIMIAIEVFSRALLGSPTAWAGDTTQLVFGAYAIMGGAYGLRERLHVKVDVVYLRWSPRTRVIVDLIMFGVFFFFCAILLWQSGRMAYDSVLNKEMVVSIRYFPVYHVKALMPVGVSLLLLQGVIDFIRNLSLLLRGKSST